MDGHHQQRQGDNGEYEATAYHLGWIGWAIGPASILPRTLVVYASCSDTSTGPAAPALASMNDISLGLKPVGRSATNALVLQLLPSGQWIANDAEHLVPHLRIHLATLRRPGRADRQIRGR